MMASSAEGNIYLNNAILFISPYKAGSTMLFSYVADLFRCLDIRFIDYPTYYYHVLNKLDVFYNDPNAFELYKDPICYVGHRELPVSLVDSGWCKSAHTFALIRDPRDALVSMYYSFLGSHIPPQCLKDTDKFEADKLRVRSSTDIDNYVLSASESYLKNVKMILDFCSKSRSFTLLRYEDVIFKKSLLVKSIIELIELNSKLSDLYDKNKELIDEITARYDVVPTEEMPRSHIRKVTPGDWSNKLKTETNRSLKSIFSAELSKLYPDLLMP